MDSDTVFLIAELLGPVIFLGSIPIFTVIEMSVTNHKGGFECFIDGCVRAFCLVMAFFCFMCLFMD